MSILAGIGSVLGGLGSLGGALGGLLGGEHVSTRDQIRYQGRILRGTVENAHSAGLHPLSVLGSPIAGNFAVPVPNVSRGDRLSAASEAIGRAGDALSARALQKEEAARQLRMDDAQLEESKARVGLYAAQAREADARAVASARAHTVASGLNSNRGAWPKVTALGYQWTPGAGTNSPTSAQQMQDEYGDIVENVYGLGRLAGDAIEFAFRPRPGPRESLSSGSTASPYFAP